MKPKTEQTEVTEQADGRLEIVVQRGRPSFRKIFAGVAFLVIALAMIVVAKIIVQDGEVVPALWVLAISSIPSLALLHFAFSSVAIRVMDGVITIHRRPYPLRARLHAGELERAKVTTKTARGDKGRTYVDYALTLHARGGRTVKVQRFASKKEAGWVKKLIEDAAGAER